MTQTTLFLGRLGAALFFVLAGLASRDAGAAH
jgi:hypothetical protein